MKQRNAKEAFEDALQSHNLSLNSQDPNYIAAYMYIGSTDSHDRFKHIETRQYLTVPRTQTLMLETQAEIFSLVKEIRGYL